MTEIDLEALELAEVVMEFDHFNEMLHAIRVAERAIKADDPAFEDIPKEETLARLKHVKTVVALSKDVWCEARAPSFA